MLQTEEAMKIHLLVFAAGGASVDASEGLGTELRSFVRIPVCSPCSADLLLPSAEDASKMLDVFSNVTSSQGCEISQNTSVRVLLVTKLNPRCLRHLTKWGIFMPLLEMGVKGVLLSSEYSPVSH